MIKDNSYYKLKYLKYKSKYINYKNLIGGTQGPELSEQQLQEQQKRQIQKIYKELYPLMSFEQKIVIPQILLTGTDKQKENAIKLYIIISKDFNKFLEELNPIFKNDMFNIGHLFDTNGTMTLFLKNKLKELFKKLYVSKFVIDGLTENSKLYKDHTELFKIIVDKICFNLHRLQIVSTDNCDDETRNEIVSNFFNSRVLFEKLVLKIVDEKIKKPDADKNGEMLEAFILCIVKSEDIDLETKKDIVGLIFFILQQYHLKYDDMIICNPQLRKATVALFYPTECYKLKIAHKLFEKVSALKDEITTNQENVKKLLQKEKLEEQLQPLRKKLEIQLSEIEQLKKQLFEIEQLKNQKQLLESKIKELEEKIKELDQLKEQLKLLQQQLQPLEQKELQLKEQEQKQLKELEILQKEKDPLEQKIKLLKDIFPTNTLTLEIKRLKAKQQKEAEIKQQQEAKIKQQQQEAEPRQQEELRQRQQERIDNLLKKAHTLFKEGVDKD